MAVLKTVLENLDDLPEAHHELYTEKDGKFYVNVDGIDEHPTVVALKNAFERQKTERRKASEELTKLKERLAKIPEDFDPDEYATLKAKLEEYEADPTKNKGDDKERQEAVAARKMLEQKIASLEKKHAEEITKKNDEIKKRDVKISNLLIDDGLTKALLESGVGPQYMKASKALLRQDCTVIEEDGDYKAIVKTDTGDLDISRYVSDWVASDEGKVFVPPAKGGDAGGGNKPAKPISVDKNPWAKDSYNLTEQGRILREDRAKAEKLAKAAGVRLPPVEAA